MEKTCGRAAILKELNNLISYNIVVRADDCGAACLKEVVIFITVNIIKPVALCLYHNNRERIVESKIVLNAAGNDCFSLFNLLLRLFALLCEVLFLIFFKRRSAD